MHTLDKKFNITIGADASAVLSAPYQGCYKCHYMRNISPNSTNYQSRTIYSTLVRNISLHSTNHQIDTIYSNLACPTVYNTHPTIISKHYHYHYYNTSSRLHTKLAQTSYTRNNITFST